MSYISNFIDQLNKNNRIALTIFLTAGYPDKNSFVEQAIEIIDAGADILEIGVPFGDSLADGPVVQSSYLKSLDNGVNLDTVFEYIRAIKTQRDNPIIIMSAANPLIKFGKKNFSVKAEESGVDGLIIPDIPLEEHEEFFTSEFDNLDKIILTTPTSSTKRIEKIDENSSGFVYCVSVVGTTGVRDKFDEYVLNNLNRTYGIIKKNKMQIGFGISSPQDVKTFAPYCDGVIVGSAVIKMLSGSKPVVNCVKFVESLSEACNR